MGDCHQLLGEAGLNSSTLCPLGESSHGQWLSLLPALLGSATLELSSLLFLTCFSCRMISYIRETFLTCLSFSSQKSLSLERNLQEVNPGSWGNKDFFQGWFSFPVPPPPKGPIKEEWAKPISKRQSPSVT